MSASGCNTITIPTLVEGDSLTRFNVVVGSRPFGLEKWGHDFVDNDPYNRAGGASSLPETKGDYAFIGHMIETALDSDGRVGLIMPHGVLFTGGAEGKIRQKSIERNILEAVIVLPANLFFGTGIPAAIVMCNRDRRAWINARTCPDKHVLVVHARRVYLGDKNENRIRPQDIEGHLNIPRYVNTFKPDPGVDISAVRKEIADLEIELSSVESELAGYVNEIVL